VSKAHQTAMHLSIIKYCAELVHSDEYIYTKKDYTMLTSDIETIRRCK